jgi:hypothetical protein
VPKFIEVPHELRNSNSLLLDDPPEPGKQVIEIVGSLVPDGGLGLPGFVGVALEGIGVGFRKSVSDLVIAVDVSDELVVVDVGEVASVHILFQY